MSTIRLYKKFYCVGIIRTGNTIDQNYILLDPYSLSANTYVAGTGATESPTLIESSLSITQESTGVYYADLNPFLYASDVTYDLVWFVNYISSAPIKRISTRFRINVNSVTNQFEIEFVDSRLELEFINSVLEIDYENHSLTTELGNSSLEIDLDLGDSLDTEIL